MALRDLTDEQLVAECRLEGSAQREAAKDELFSRHYATVARWCLRMTSDREAAADLAQDVFLKAHRYLDSFRGQSRFSTWLYTIARNETADRFKSMPAPVESEEILADLADDAPGPEQQADIASRGRRVREFLASTLDETERAVFALHFGEDMPLAAVTRTLGLDNRSGAKAYLVSARRKLARVLDRSQVALGAREDA